MIIETAGNLLHDDAQALVNTVNTVGVMGKGLALQFKRAFPENFTTYARACRDGRVRPGHILAVPAGDGRWILNFPTKRHWRQPSRLEDIADGLDDLVRVIEELGLRSIAVPPLGCGNGRLPWTTVRPLILDKPWCAERGDPAVRSVNASRRRHDPNRAAKE
jgi:O-acetyl-ADP-ribose deacetylase (regulator of RNase III)